MRASQLKPNWYRLHLSSLPNGVRSITAPFVAGKTQGVVRLIAMPHELFICNICVGTCNAAVARNLGNESLLEQTEKGQYAQEPSVSL